MIGPRHAIGAVQRQLASLRKAAVAEVEDINRLIYHVLRGGVVLSLSFLIFAMLLLVVEGGSLPDAAVPPRDLLARLERFEPDALMTLGVVLLILTPVARVLLSLVSFVEERDATFVLITGVVFANLLVSLALGVG